MWFKALAAAGMLFVAGTAQAQVVYEPVQSQYRVNDRCFYYGGNNPRAVEYARRQAECFQSTQVSPIGTFGSGYLRRGLINEPAQYTVSDCAIYRNAVVYGYTSVDARNDAYANVPRFFRMADLHAAAVPASDGMGVVVPAQPAAAGKIQIRAKSAAPSTQPATQPRPVIIIPKPDAGEDRLVSVR